MSKPIIEINNISKKYKIGAKEPYFSLRDVLAGLIKNPIDYLMPRKKVGDGLLEQEFWALKDVSFNVEQGEVIGIIGRNGAGKSTLLKILSRITPPTIGEVVLRGRMASLLEVGTGFHPELTGRENVFLNGAILGMKRWEVNKKFKQIVEFAEVEKFLDTPVKHYSSGMYMRLAFAVAAHLEPEILVIDEVLAVGDAEFQKKCLGKMEDVSKHDGRTILFVSHNLSAIQRLCERSIYMDNGKVSKIGKTPEVIDTYVNKNNSTSELLYSSTESRQGNGKCRITKIDLSDSFDKPKDIFEMGENIQINLNLEFNQKIDNLEASILITNLENEQFSHIINDELDLSKLTIKNSKLKIKVILDNIFFTPDLYKISVWLGNSQEVYDYLIDCCKFNMVPGSVIKRKLGFPKHIKFFIPSKWIINC